jgi:hypothetical protein
VPTILRNDEAEALILDLRTARAAQRQRIEVDGGAFLIFSTSIVLPAPEGGQLVFPLRCDTEPGSVVTGPGSGHVTGTVAGITVAGTFNWTLDAGSPPGASYRFTRGGRETPPPSWAAELPPSQVLHRENQSTLARRQSSLRRRGSRSEYLLLTLTEQLLRHSCRGPIHHTLRFRPAVDVDDLVQRGLQTASRLDMHREVSRLDLLPAQVTAALALADACGIDLRADPTAGWDSVVDTARRLGWTVPRVSVSQLQAAVRASDLIAHAATTRA